MVSLPHRVGWGPWRKRPDPGKRSKGGPRRGVRGRARRAVYCWGVPARSRQALGCVGAPPSPAQTVAGATRLPRSMLRALDALLERRRQETPALTRQDLLREAV